MRAGPATVADAASANCSNCTQDAKELVAGRVPMNLPTTNSQINRSRVCYGDVVRIVGSQGNNTAIDCDEDGIVDGWVKTDKLSSNFKQRAVWENDRIRRRDI